MRKPRIVRKKPPRATTLFFCPNCGFGNEQFEIVITDNGFHMMARCGKCRIAVEGLIEAEGMAMETVRC